MEQSRLDRPSFGLSAAIILLTAIPLFAFPNESSAFLESLYATIAREFGILYLLASVAAIGFLTWLAFGRYGKVRLGEDDNGKPEFSEISWVGMLFCAGVGAGLMYWCGVEWAFYYDAATIGWLFDIEPGDKLEIAVVVLCIALFAASVWLGLKKGIKRLSDINVGLAFGLLVFILLAGPTVFLLKTSLNSLGVMAQNFLRMNFWTDPFTDSGFVESWTIFYWAWWIAFAPYVGLFVTRISKGRTLRQMITGMLIWGSLGSWLFYMVMGNYGLFLELNGTVDFTGILREQSGNAAIVAMLETLPMAAIVIGVFSVIAIIFAATTYDSASYTLASSATLHLKAGDDPARWHRVFWALALGVMPVVLMLLDGDLRAIQVILLVVSLPILLVGVVMSVALVKSLKAASYHGPHK